MEDDTVNIIWDDLKDLREKQNNDTHLKKYFDYILNQKLPENRLMARKIVAECNHLVVYDNILYHIWNKNS